MVLGVSKLEKRYGEWYAVEGVGRFAGFVSAVLANSHAFLFVEEDWRLVFIGPVRLRERKHGDEIDYSGPAIENPFFPGAICPIPGVEPGVWVAYDPIDDDFWKLEKDMVIRFTSLDDPGYFPFTPRGRCVCQAYLCNGKQETELGKLALDLECLPFPKELWGYTESEFLDRERVVDFDWDVDEIKDTLRFTDYHASEVIFWLM